MSSDKEEWHGAFNDFGWVVDPHGVIPIGFTSPILGGRVLGFCAPAGSRITRLMVVVERPESNSYTTMNYLVALRSYLTSLSDLEFTQKHL